MSKEELVTLLKKYKELKAKMKSCEKEIAKIDNQLTREKFKQCNDIKISSNSLEINSDIHSKNSISDKTANQAITHIDTITELNNKEKKIFDEMRECEYKVEYIDIRLNALTEKEYLVVYNHFIEGFTYSYIGNNQYYSKFKQTRSEKVIQKISDIAINKMIKI